LRQRPCNQRQAGALRQRFGETRLAGSRRTHEQQSLVDGRPGNPSFSVRGKVGDDGQVDRLGLAIAKQIFKS
jgi:hypothetical protein